MISAINGVMLAAGSSLAASIVAKATIVMVLGLAGSWLARRNRAAVRHVLLAAAFVVLAGLPIASVVVPPVRIVVRGAAQGQNLRGLSAVGQPIPRGVPAGLKAGVSSEAARSVGPSLPAVLLAVWIAGTALFLLPVAMGLWQVRGLRRSAIPWRQGQPMVDGLAIEGGIGPRVELLLHEAVPGPMTCGLLHPAIVLPQDAQTWGGEDLHRAIVHELEHVRRGDWVSHCVARAVCAVYWFHPLIWILWQRFSVEAERACDDAVLARSEATAYADQLVGLARRMALYAKTTSAKSPLLAMANRADLGMRVSAVLDSGQRRGRAGRFSVGLACAAAAVLMLVISPLRTVAAPQDAGTDPVGLFQVRTGLVVVAVTVSDRNGLSIEDLAANDFALTEDGVAQKISTFEFQKQAQSAGTQSAVSSYYLLGYYTPNQRDDGQLRKIEVTCKKFPMAELHYRPSYYANQPPGGDGVRGSKRGTGQALAPDTKPPVIIYKVNPEYSEEARKAKYQGTVALSIEVDTSGSVTNVRVLRGLGLALDEKAIEAVKKWRFKPGTKGGQPITMTTQVNVDFRLL